MSALLASLAGVSTLILRKRLAGPGRLAAAVALVVPLFLAFDVAGAARGWFASSPAFSLAIVRPGIPLEEPVLLAFLVTLSIALWRGAERLLAGR